MQRGSLPLYIADTHTLYWWRKDAARLGPAAASAFNLAILGEAHIIIPAIVVAEMYYLTQKLGSPVLPTVLLLDIEQSQEFIFSELGRAQLEAMEQVTSVPEMHDRLIAA